MNVTARYKNSNSTDQNMVYDKSECSSSKKAARENIYLYALTLEEIHTRNEQKKTS